MAVWKRILVSGSNISDLNNDVGYATTGSNTFQGNQTINGNLVITGSLTAQQYIISSSVIYITQSNYSGSTIFGNSFDDTHQFTGSLFLTGSAAFIGTHTITGSLFITGSTTQVGNNNLFGNTTLSGSIIISGSTITPTIQIYGNTTHNGYLRFDPVMTNIDNSISASYIYVSGSTNDLYFTQNGAGYANTTRLRWLEGNLYTGLLHGGVVSQVNSNTYQISSGSGIIVTLNASLDIDPYPTVQYLNWGNLTHTIDALSGSYDQQFIAIDSTTNIFAQGIPFNDGDYNNKIPIGIVLHQNRSSINGVQTFPGVAYGWKQRSFDFIKAFGPLKISGYNLSPSGSSTGSLVLSGGTSWVDGRNYTIDPNSPSYIDEVTGVTTSKIFRYHQSGSGWVYDTNAGAGYPTIDPSQYSNNGTLTPLTNNNKWSIQRVYYFPNSATKALYVYYGNAQYDTKADAITAINTETFSEAPNTAANAIFVGYMILQKIANFTVPSTYEFKAASMFRAAGSGGAGGGGAGITTLAGLTDVSITAPTTGDLLIYGASGGTQWNNTKTLSGSYTLSGSLTTNDGVSVQTLTASFVSASSGITGSLFGTASWATNAISASFLPIGTYQITSSWAQSASQALTASYTPNALITASVSTNVLTFTKGDGTAFNLTVNTGSAVTPGGSNTHIQFNSASVFSGSGLFAYNYVSHSLIQGSGVVASGLYSHAEGDATQASAIGSHAEGFSSIASGVYSHAEGDSTISSGSYSHAEGVNTQAVGLGSHTEGGDTIASGLYSHAEGTSTIASGRAAHAEGNGTSAIRTGSHAEGYFTIADANYSHVEGWQTSTQQVNINTTGSIETLYAFIDSTDTVVSAYPGTTQISYLLWETNQASGGNRRLWLSNLTNTFSDGTHQYFNITALDNQGPFGTGNVTIGSYVYDLNSRSNSYDLVYTYIDYDDSAGTITVAGDLSGIDIGSYVGVVFTIPSVGTVLQDIDIGNGITYDSGLDLSTIPLGSIQTSINNDLPSLSGTYSGGTVIFTTVDSGGGWGSFYEGSLLTTPTNATKYYDSATSSSKFPSSFASFLENNSYVIANNEITLIASSSISGSELTVFYATNPYVNDQYSQLTVTKGWGSHAAGGNNNSTGTAQNSVGVYNNGNYNSLFIIGDGYDDAANRHNVVDVRRGLVTIDGNTTITGSVNITGSLLINGSAPGGGGTPLATLVQSTPSNSWTFNHSLGVTNPIVTVYDSNNKVIIPQEISASDSNTLIITFPTTLTGTAVAAGGTYVGTTPTNAITASYALLAATASYVLNAISSSFASTASLAPNYVLNSATSSMLSPYVLSSVTSSMLSPYALSSTLSSYVLNSATSSLATTGSNTFNGDQTINGDLIFGIPSSPGFNGEIVKFGSGTLTAGLLYFLSSSGTWSLADATITSSSIGMLGIAVGSSPTANGLLIRGFAANASYNYGTGAIVYMQTGSGVMTATAPTGTNQVVRVMGYQTTTANTIYFDPDKTWVTLA